MTYRQSLVDLLLRAQGHRHPLRYDADWLLHIVDSWRVVLGIPSVFG